MNVRRIQIEAVELRLTPEEARSVGHMLGMYASEAAQGTFGHGTSIDDDIALAQQVKDALAKAAEPRI